MHAAILLIACALPPQAPPVTIDDRVESLEARVAALENSINRGTAHDVKRCFCPDCKCCNACPGSGDRDAGESNVAHRVSPYDTSVSPPVGEWQTSPDGTRWRVVNRGEVSHSIRQPPTQTYSQTYAPPQGFRVQCGPGGCRLIRR